MDGLALWISEHVWTFLIGGLLLSAALAVVAARSAHRGFKRARSGAASWRVVIVPLEPEQGNAAGLEDRGHEEPEDAFARPARLTWAKLIRKVYEVDPLLCPFCSTEIGTRRRRRRGGAAAPSGAKLWAGCLIHPRLRHRQGDPQEPPAPLSGVRGAGPLATRNPRAHRKVHLILRSPLQLHHTEPRTPAGAIRPNRPAAWCETYPDTSTLSQDASTYLRPRTTALPKPIRRPTPASSEKRFPTLQYRAQSLARRLEPGESVLRNASPYFLRVPCYRRPWPHTPRLEASINASMRSTSGTSPQSARARAIASSLSRPERKRVR